MIEKNKTFFFIKILIIAIAFITINQSNVVKADTTSDVSVTCQGQVQNIGWQNAVPDGQQAGTVGQALRLESVKINLNNALPGMYVTYQVHAQNIGWMDSVQDSQIAGTVGKSLRLEAIKVQLHNATDYHIQYQVHVQDIGWMDWVQDGQEAGTTGRALRIEAIRIKIVKDNVTYGLSYQAHVEDIGWQNAVSDGLISGTVGKSLRMEALKINVQNLRPGMNIKYQVHVQNIGWMDWIKNGQMAGTTGKNLRIEAVRIVLESMPGYHVQYQAQVQALGWMPWTQDGGDAGTTGKNLQLEAIKIQIVRDKPTEVTAQNVITQPANSTSLLNNQSVNLTGYALNQYDNKEVDVYIDGAFAGKASTGLDSTQVNSSGYLNGTKSGYYIPIHLNTMSDGKHTLLVQAIGNDQTLSNKEITVNVHALQPIVCIDTPTGGTFIKNEAGQLSINGWSLNSFGVNKVQIYIDNQYKGDATINGYRPDVNKAYPNYTNGSNSGFIYNLDSSSLSSGVHTIMVKSTGNDGIITSLSERICKLSSSNQTTTNYNLTINQVVDTQMAYGEPVSDSSGSWVTAGRGTVAYYVDPFNFMDSYSIYQFLRLDYIQGISADDLNKILAGRGVLNGTGGYFLKYAQENNINPIYLVSHAILETGSGTSKLATGINVNGTTVYNLFGIQAYDADANYYGSQYAYSQGWTNVEKAISGGARWISSRYINNSTYKQNTLYKMRWNPASTGNHQYATDVQWAYKQVYLIKKLTDMCQNPSLQFDIPQYK